MHDLSQISRGWRNDSSLNKGKGWHRGSREREREKDENTHRYAVKGEREREGY